MRLFSTNLRPSFIKYMYNIRIKFERQVVFACTTQIFTFTNVPYFVARLK